ncbi:MAG: HAMP domain-containing histidine kinase, partial [Bacteroidetes bacterium]|nr:HAMP domain-containing histidine kinase [Bacteroidota bacterium]
NNAFYACTERSRSTVNEKQKAESLKPNAESYKPMVSISSKKTDGKIELTVKDNGNGIPKSIVDKIFQPFFTTKPTGKGTGLGLSLAYDIVKAHGGEIKINTKENEGTEFTITLPA